MQYSFFAKLEYPQVALVRAERNTGHVLKSDFLLFRRGTDPEEAIYTIFDSLNKAEIYIKESISKTSDFEFIIYDHKGERIKVI